MATKKTTAPEPTTEVETGPAMDSLPPADVDHVAMVSRRADGTPDQTEGFVVLDASED